MTAKLLIRSITMNTKTLRQKILDLAIHGKLVPQDPDDEPASGLLKRIKAEKEEQIKEGKIKQSKKTKTTSDTPKSENPPFEIPSSWEWTTLGEATIMKRGTSATKGIMQEGNIPVISGGRQPAYSCNISNRTGEVITVAGSGAGAGYVQYWNEPGSLTL